MTEVINQGVAHALMQALETMAFINANPALEIETIPEQLRFTGIDFSGPQTGRLEILCSRAFGEMLSGNLMAEEEGSSRNADDRANDALKELVNITCGLWLRESGFAGGSQAEMSVPTQFAADAAQWQAMHSAGAIALDAEGHPLLIRITESD